MFVISLLVFDISLLVSVMTVSVFCYINASSCYTSVSFLLYQCLFIISWYRDSVKLILLQIFFNDILYYNNSTLS